MNWFYADSGQQRGPVTDAEFQQLVSQGVIRPDTLVWNETLTNWQPWSALAPSDSAHSSGPPTLSDGRLRCSECQQLFAPDEIVEVSGRPVCSACKPAFLQRLQEGANLASNPGNFSQSAMNTGTLTADQVADQDYSIDAPGRIGEGWDFLTKPDGNALMIGVLIFLIFGGIHLFRAILGIIPLIGILFGMAGGLAAIFVIIPVLGGLQLAYLHRLRTRNSISVEQTFRLGFSERYWPMIGVTLLSGLLASLAFLPLALVAGVGIGVTIVSAQNRGGPPEPTTIISLVVVGGVLLLVSIAAVYFLMTNWYYSLLLVADKRLPVTDAMRLSWRVTRRHWWQNFFLIFLTGLVTMAGTMACLVGLLVAMPLVTAAKVLQYERLFGRLARLER